MSSRILVDEIYGKTSNSSALTIGSNGLVTPKAVAFQVEATGHRPKLYSKCLCEDNLGDSYINTGSYWDTTNNRYTPQVAGWYLFLAQSEFNSTVL